MFARTEPTPILNSFKTALFRVFFAVLFSLPVYFILQQNVPRFVTSYKAELLTQKDGNLADIDADGHPELFHFYNISEKQIYLEMWSQGFLLGVWTADGQVTRHSVIMDQQGKTATLFFISSVGKQLYVNELRLEIRNKKLVSSCLQTPLVENSEQDDTEFLQKKMIDLDGDGRKEYVFSMAVALDLRNMVAYYPKSGRIVKSNTDFMMVTDFMPFGGKPGQLLFTSYANGNVYAKNVRRMVDLYHLDTSLYSRYYSDHNSYLGIADSSLRVKEIKMQRKGFTSMYRLIPVTWNNRSLYICASTFLNQPDTLPQISLLDSGLNVIRSKNISLPVKKEAFHKYKTELFYVKEGRGNDHVYFAGNNDTVYELNEQLQLLPVIASTNVSDKSRLEFIDLDSDGQSEILLSGPKGLEIYQEGFLNKVAVEMDDFSALKSGRVKGIKNWEFITDTNRHLTLSYSLNPWFYWKMPVFLATIVLVFSILSLLLWLNGRKIEKENRRLEELVQERTREVLAQKAIADHQRELVEEKQKEIIDSITYAKHIQNAILAKEEDILKHFPESFLLYLPKDIVAGDFYFFESTATHVFYAAADCTGHGVPGALVSVVCSNALSRCVKEFGLTRPGEILDKARELVLDTFRKSGQDVKDGMDISLLVKDLQTDTYSWAGANNPLWIIHSKGFTEIKPNKQSIGMNEDPKPFLSHPLKIEKGEFLYLFTDGFADQFGGDKGKKFKYRQLLELLLKIKDEPAATQKQTLAKVFSDWKGRLEQIDDVCIIGIRA